VEVVIKQSPEENCDHRAGPGFLAKLRAFYR
jgi:hypothetical protein